MKKSVVMLVAWWAFAGLSGSAPWAQGRKTEEQPQTHVFTPVNGVDLKAHVFRPAQEPPGAPRSAIVLFHGGGWYMGEPEWVFSRARRFAALGLVAVAAQYRLSDQKTISPLEAMADARAVIRWTRANSARLGINPDRIAAYGISAGGHLAASAAIFSEPAERDQASAAPNALVLVSPALQLEGDPWPQRLLGSRASASSISPVSHVRTGLPPTLILQGDVDTVTPLAGAQLFCQRMRAANNRCDLTVYRGFGHVFTPAGSRDDAMPQPDPKIAAEASVKADEFLASLGYVKPRATARR